jgi:hypothetical protein
MALRQRRLEQLKARGMIDENGIAHEVVPAEVSEWDQLDEYAKACSSRCMEACVGW